MTRMLFVLGCVLVAAGCRVNRAPVYLHMTTDEMQRAIDERFCAGMSAADVTAQLDADNLTYFADRDATGTLGVIEVRVMALGVLRQTRPLFGRMILGFHEDKLISIDYGHPVDDSPERWDFTAYPLVDCEATGMGEGEAPAEEPADAPVEESGAEGAVE